MPYIIDEKRHPLDPVIDHLHSVLVDMETDDDQNNMEENLNYVISRLLMMVYGDRDSTRYSQINDAVGMLECAKLEFYSKVAAPYQDQKEYDNGSVERFQTPGEVVGSIEIRGGKPFADLTQTININAEHLVPEPMTVTVDEGKSK